jgi:hypothetical protein
MARAFFCERRILPKVYFLADLVEVTEEMNEMAKQRKIPPHPRGKAYQCRHVLSVSMAARLESYEKGWAEHRIQHMREGMPHDMEFYAAISQNASYGNKFATLIPTLVKNSMIYGEAEKRVFLPNEHLAIQGLGAYAYDHDSYINSPIKWLLTPEHLHGAYLKPEDHRGFRVVSSSKRALTGNGMHVASVGCALLLCLAGTRPRSFGADPEHPAAAEAAGTD